MEVRMYRRPVLKVFNCWYGTAWYWQVS